MATDDDDIEPACVERGLVYGNDSTPLMSYVPEPSPSHWGKVTSQSRTCSAAYMKFLGKEVRDG